MAHTITDVIGADMAQQGTVRRFTFFDGERQMLQLKGERNTIKALYDSYKVVAGFTPTYDEINYQPDRGGATLTLAIIEDGQPVYELSANELQNPIETHPYFAGMTDEQIVNVRKAYSMDLPEDASWTALQLQLSRYYRHGWDTSGVSQYVLRETKNVSKRSTVTASFENVNEVSTPPTVSAVNTLIGNLPDGEWLKKAPVVRQIGNQRWQIITEWWWAIAHSKIFYKGTLEYTS